MTQEIKSSKLKIGMEVHVELCTKSKMFSRAENPAFFLEEESNPNVFCDPLVLGLPGALPVPNREAVAYAIRVGIALNSKISSWTRWDRKNYFYPDLPKGYQISQHTDPICLGGFLDILIQDEKKRIQITRAHLEEDTGKLIHEESGKENKKTLIDYNRSGAPLLEIVSEPQMTSPEEAVAYAKALREICVFLGVTRGIMQRGHLRFEPNVNVVITTIDGQIKETPIAEIKNINSFRSIDQAIRYEHNRQIEQWLETGEILAPGNKTTRGYDDKLQITVLQRAKEEAHDYRYFPDPDLVPLEIDHNWIKTIKKSIPELCQSRRERYMLDWGIEKKDIEALLDRPELSNYFEKCVNSFSLLSKKSVELEAVFVAKFILNTLAKRARQNGRRIEEESLTPNQIASLLILKRERLVNTSSFDLILDGLTNSDSDPKDVADTLGLLQVSDSNLMNRWIDQAIESQPQAAADFSKGKDAAIGRLIGEVKKASSGKADLKKTRQALVSRLRHECNL